jgi:phosphoglycerate kinase
MERFRTLDGLDVRGKRVLVRTDLNVPIENGVVTDASRIESHVPTLRELAGRDGRVIVLSHLGRPKGKIVPSLSLRPVAAALAKSLGRSVRFAEDCVGPKVKSEVDNMRDGDVLLLENTRFHAGEEQGDEAFAKEVAQLGDLFVNDAFSVAHRAHATTTTLAYELPSAAGRAMQSELSHLHAALDDPERPLMAVVGGAKVSGKIGVLENLVKRVETLAIGGAMANTFLAAEGMDVGRSMFEAEQLDTARHVVSLSVESGTTLLLPVDVVVADALEAGRPTRIVEADGIGRHDMALDVGPQTIEAFERRLHNTRTLVWNGPLGAFETPPFDRGTIAAAKLVAQRTKAGNLLSVAGGGDTIAALNRAGVVRDFSYISTAGGAFLEWLEGRELPGVAALTAQGA